MVDAALGYLLVGFLLSWWGYRLRYKPESAWWWDLICIVLWPISFFAGVIEGAQE